MENSVLFDIPGGADPVDHEFLEQLGHRVMVCPGPGPGTTCPLLTGDGCALQRTLTGSCSTRPGSPQHREILADYKESLRSDVPIRVVVRPGQALEHADLLRGLKVITSVPVAGDLDALAAEVEAADSGLEES